MDQLCHRVATSAALTLAIFAGVQIAAGPPLLAAAPKKERSSKKIEDFRIWSNLEGTIRVEAKFVSLNRGQVELERRGGERVTIKLDDLSAEDRDFVNRWQAWQLVAEARALFKKPPPLRATLPAVILVSHPDVRRQLGLLSPRGRTPSAPETDLLAVVQKWLESPRLELLAGPLANGVRWEDRIEMLFREADAYEKEVQEVLSVNLTRDLNQIASTTFAPLMTRPTAWSYLQLRGIDERISLSPEQRAKIDALTPEQASARESRDLLAILTKEQLEQLDQVRWQLDPFLELMSNPKALQKVRIPAAKRNELRAAQYEMGPRVLARIIQGSLTPADVGLNDLSRRYLREVADTFEKTLSPDQRDRLKVVLGETFHPWSEKSPFAPVGEDGAAAQTAATTTDRPAVSDD